MAERTGCPVLLNLWSYVKFLEKVVYTSLCSCARWSMKARAKVYSRKARAVHMRLAGSGCCPTCKSHYKLSPRPFKPPTNFVKFSKVKLCASQPSIIRLTSKYGCYAFVLCRGCRTPMVQVQRAPRHLVLYEVACEY